MSLKKIFKLKNYMFKFTHDERWKLTLQWNSLWQNKPRLSCSVDEVQVLKNKYFYILLMGTQKDIIFIRINVAISSKAIYSFTLDLAIPHLGICPKYILTNIKKAFICTGLSIVVNRNNPIYKNFKQPKCPSVWNWLNKIWFTYSLNGILCSYIKEWVIYN